MKTSTFISLLATTAAAAPVVNEKRQDLSALLGAFGGGGAAGGAGGFDLSAIGPLLGGLDLSSFAPLLANLDLSKIGASLGIDLGGLDLGKLFGGAGGAAPVAAATVGVAPFANVSTTASAMGGMKMPNPLGALGLTPDVMGSMAKMFMGGLTKQKAYKMEEMTPLLRPTAKRVKMIHGPYRLRGTANNEKVGNGFSMDPSGTGYMYSLDSDFPRDITIIDVKSGVFDEDMKPIDIERGLYNHHNIFFDMAGRVPAIASCGAGKAVSGMGGYQIPMAIFMGGATESTGLPYTSMDGKFNSGYYLGANAKVTNMIDIVNYNKEDKNVYTISEMEYIPGQVADALPAASQVIDIQMCDGKSGLVVHPPEGVKQWAINGSEITMTKKGYFLNAKAHLHDGGVGIQTFLNGKEVCNSKAVYGGEGHEGKMPDGTAWNGISSTTICEHVVPIEVGDKMRFVATFDTALHPEREQEDHGKEEGGLMAEGMALFTGSFAVAPGH